MRDCAHEWDQIFEESIVGPAFPTGWRCATCKAFVSASEITPAGLGGTVTGRKRLHGIHGGLGNCADGSLYKEQIIHPDGRLEIIR